MWNGEGRRGAARGSGRVQGSARTSTREDHGGSQVMKCEGTSVSLIGELGWALSGLSYKPADKMSSWKMIVLIESDRECAVRTMDRVKMRVRE